MTGIRRAFHKPDDSVEFAKYWGRELTLEEIDLIEQHREMTCRIAWKPYMHSLTLPHLLPSICTRTLIVQGEDDKITPRACGEFYARTIPNAALATIPGCGHMPEMEKPEEFVRTVNDFFAD